VSSARRCGPSSGESAVPERDTPVNKSARQRARSVAARDCRIRAQRGSGGPRSVGGASAYPKM
jgi:hypothetical protein